LAPVEKEAVGAAEIFRDERAPGLAADQQVLGRHIGIIEDEVVVVGAADPDLRAGEAKPRRNVAVAPQHLDPGYLFHCTASRQRLVRVTALSKETPCMTSRDTNASSERSWVSVSTQTS